MLIYMDKRKKFFYGQKILNNIALFTLYKFFFFLLIENTQ